MPACVLTYVRTYVDIECVLAAFPRIQLLCCNIVNWCCATTVRYVWLVCPGVRCEEQANCVSVFWCSLVLRVHDRSPTLLHLLGRCTHAVLLVEYVGGGGACVPRKHAVHRQSKNRRLGSQAAVTAWRGATTWGRWHPFRQLLTRFSSSSSVCSHCTKEMNLYRFTTCKSLTINVACFSFMCA